MCLLERFSAPTGKCYIDNPNTLFLAFGRKDLSQTTLWTTNSTWTMCIAHCSLFMTFIHRRHKSIVYRFNKHHKHHSTYTSMCHCYEPGHFATFSPGSTSTPLSHTRLHLTNRLVWLKGRPCVDSLKYLYVYRISTICVLVSDGKKIGFPIYLSLYYYLKGRIYAI